MNFRQTRVQRLCFAAGFCALLAAGCSQQSADESADTSAKSEVTLTRVARSDISQTLSLNGTASALPNGDVRVSALVPGRIAELNVAEGDRVRARQVVAKLDDRSYRSQLQQAEAGAQQAKANFDNAQLSRTRDEDLFQRGIVARKELEDARTQESVAAAARKQSEAALEIAKLQVARCEIVSPLNGAVAKRFVSVGEQVDGTAAQPIVEVANLQEIEFLGNAPAMYLAKMHPGEIVYVTSESVPGQKFQGRVEAISPAVDPTTGVGLVRIRVPNPNGLLRMGIFLSAEIAVDTHARALTVPAEAIYRDRTGQARVFIVQQDSATAVPVKIGIETKDRVELADGAVKEGDSVILAGGYGLADQAKIQIKPQSNP
ncbi:MAG: efflux RND transporter periplasmic adaptor subunit [Candidatus Acidiferrales bacterium]